MCEGSYNKEESSALTKVKRPSLLFFGNSRVSRATTSGHSTKPPTLPFTLGMRNKETSVRKRIKLPDPDPDHILNEREAKIRAMNLIAISSEDEDNLLVKPTSPYTRKYAKKERLRKTKRLLKQAQVVLKEAESTNEEIKRDLEDKRSLKTTNAANIVANLLTLLAFLPALKKYTLIFVAAINSLHSNKGNMKSLAVSVTCVAIWATAAEAGNCSMTDHAHPNQSNYRSEQDLILPPPASGTHPATTINETAKPKTINETAKFTTSSHQPPHHQPLRAPDHPIPTKTTILVHQGNVDKSQAVKSPPGAANQKGRTNNLIETITILAAFLTLFLLTKTNKSLLLRLLTLTSTFQATCSQNLVVYDSSGVFTNTSVPMRAVNLNTVESCSKSYQSYKDPIKNNVQVLSITETNSVVVTNCLIMYDLVVSHCMSNIFASSIFAPVTIEIGTQYLFSQQECEAFHSSKAIQISIHGKAIIVSKASKSTMTEIYPLYGTRKKNGACEGVSMTINGVDYASAVLKAVVTFKTYEIPSNFDYSSKLINVSSEMTSGNPPCLSSILNMIPLLINVACTPFFCSIRVLRSLTAVFSRAGLLMRATSYRARCKANLCSIVNSCILYFLNLNTFVVNPFFN